MGQESYSMSTLLHTTPEHSYALWCNIFAPLLHLCVWQGVSLPFIKIVYKGSTGMPTQRIVLIIMHQQFSVERVRVRVIPRIVAPQIMTGTRNEATWTLRIYNWSELPLGINCLDQLLRPWIWRASATLPVNHEYLHRGCSFIKLQESALQMILCGSFWTSFIWVV